MPDINEDLPIESSNDFLDMSDEDIMNMSAPPAVKPVVVDDEDKDADQLKNQDEEKLNPGDKDDEEDLNLDEDDKEKNLDLELTAEEIEAKKLADDEADKNIDYKALYEQVMAPFKANGKDMKVDSVEDVKTLMQMGANYNKKMAALKPHLKIVRMLENHGLLDEAKLSFLIDLDKKNPAAIAKFIKDSGVDPLDLDTAKSDEYTPNTYNVGETELALDGVFTDLRESPAYPRTLDLINNKWDSASRKILLSNPDSIRTINAHIESGLYDTVWNIVERERMLGRLVNVPDLDAYKLVGIKLQESSQFNASNNGNAQNKNKPAAVSDADRQKEQARLDRKKSASSPTKAATDSGKAKLDFNPLDMSDDEFEKMSRQLLKR